MTRIEQLRKRFAAGMAEGKISAEDWEEEFLPMIANSERYQHLVAMLPVGTFADHDVFNKESWDTAIDSARTTTKETK